MRRTLQVNSQALTESLQYGVGLEDLLLHPGADPRRHRAEVLQDELGRLRLARPALARYHTRLGRETAPVG